MENAPFLALSRVADAERCSAPQCTDPRQLRDFKRNLDRKGGVLLLRQGLRCLG